MPVKRGRPVGHKLSKKTKDKIRKSRIGKSHSKETRRKISAGVNKGRTPALVQFVCFATRYIVKSETNTVMADIVAAFSEKTGIQPGTVVDYGVKYRVCLEIHGLISVASVNTIDRRIRFINPTPLFPTNGKAVKQIRDLNNMIIDYIRYMQRVNDRKRYNRGTKNRRFKYHNR